MRFKLIPVLFLLFSWSLQASGNWDIGIRWEEENLPGEKTKPAKEDPDSKNWGEPQPNLQDPVDSLFLRFDDNYSRKILEQAISDFAQSMSGIESGKKQREALQKKWNDQQYLNEKYDWQKRERLENQRKTLARLRLQNARELVTRMVRILKELDEIKNSKILSSPEFTELKSRVFREYIKAQIFQRNHKQCIPILEKYLTLTPENARDGQAHELLSTCYRQEENSAVLANANQGAVIFYRNKKNEHLVLYTAYKYGPDSPQYRHITEKIERENQQ